MAKRKRTKGHTTIDIVGTIAYREVHGRIWGGSEVESAGVANQGHKQTRVKIEKLKSKKNMIEAEDPGVMKVGTRNQFPLQYINWWTGF